MLPQFCHHPAECACLLPSLLLALMGSPLACLPLRACLLTKPECVCGFPAADLGILPDFLVLLCPAVTVPHLSFLSLPNLCWAISSVGRPIPFLVLLGPGSCPSSSVPCCLFDSPQLSFVLSSHFVSPSCSPLCGAWLSTHQFPPSSPPSLLYLHALLSGISEHP